jgi:hypothetical protein
MSALSLRFLSLLSLAVLAGCADAEDNGFPVGRDAGMDASTRRLDVAIPDGGASSSNGELCGNGIDDNHDGRVEEGCVCTIGVTQRCFVGEPSHAGVGRCVWGSQSCEGSGEFGHWTRCMGSVDAPSCEGDDGGAPIGEGEVDGGEIPDSGVQRLCRCEPGRMRFCDTPAGCLWGVQYCRPDSTWGACVETRNVPDGCKDNPFGDLFGYTYNTQCCVRQGLCCQNYPADDSVGNCAGIVTCNN